MDPKLIITTGDPNLAGNRNEGAGEIDGVVIKAGAVGALAIERLLPDIPSDG